MSRMAVDGFCPMCGCRSLGVEVSVARGPTSIVRCFHPDCPAPEGLSKILMDSEIHHVVRFDEAGYFNAKHPLRERIGNQLLDCTIHDEVGRWCDDDNPTTGTWRVKRRDDVEGEEFNEWPYLWEKL